MTDEEIAPAIIAEIVAAGIADQTRQAPRESIIATRATMHEAKRHFEAGGAVLVSEYGHEPTQTVTPITTTHDRTRTTWDALAADVKEWRNRYPNQRFYIVPTVDACTCQTRQAPRESTNKDDTRTLEWNGVTVTIGTSSGRDGAALVIIDTEGEPDGSDGWKGLRVDVNDGQVFEGVPLVLDQTRQAPRESTIVPVNESGELECTCGSNQMSAAFGSDGVRIDGAGHLVWEGVETTIDGPDWVAVVLTYGPDRRALETVRRRLAAEANTCPAPGRCGLFLHATDCPRRPSPLAAPEGWDVDYV